jgi:hypothetical protein
VNTVKLNTEKPPKELDAGLGIRDDNPEVLTAIVLTMVQTRLTRTTQQVNPSK